MEKIFAKSEEKYLKAVIVFGDDDHGYLYWDEEFTNKLTQSDFDRLFYAGSLVIKDHLGSVYKPVSVCNPGGIIAISYDSDDAELRPKRYAVDD